MKTKTIIFTALLASSLLLAGCKVSGSTVKSSEIDSVSSEEPSSSSSEERGEDVWELVEEDAYVAAITASQERSISYSRCEATGFIGEGQQFVFTNLEYLKNNKGKYVTNVDNDYVQLLNTLVNTRVTDLDYNHMGDGGRYVEPTLYVSHYGKMKFTVVESEITMTVAFDEYGYFIYFFNVNTYDSSRVGVDVSVEWFE